jgi:hypothetical protein
MNRTSPGARSPSPCWRKSWQKKTEIPSSAPGPWQLVAYEESMNSILDGLGDKLCSHH